MTDLSNIHPGEVLLEEFLKPLNMTPYRLAISLGVPQTRIAEIIKGHRAISPDTAIRLSRLFGNSEQFWLNLQATYDLEQAKKRIVDEVARIEPLKIPAV
jgi:addiction module antidote protein, HigA family